METWLTYLAALLMAGATAYTFSSSVFLTEVAQAVTHYLLSVGTVLFLPAMVITLASGVASLRKDKLTGKTIATTVLWSIVTTAVLSVLAGLAAFYFPQKLPVSASAGGDFGSLLSAYALTRDPLGLVSNTILYYGPALLAAFALGFALTPSSDVIRPAYTVMNSFSEVMYRIQRTITFFGGLFVYVSGISFFLTIWQEKTLLVAPKPFVCLACAVLAMILVVLPLLYAFFTGFRRNPYGIIGRSLAAVFFGLTTSSIYASALVNESIARSNLGVQKRFASTTTPLSILITRGGTAFVSTALAVTTLSSLGANLSLKAVFLIAGACGVMSFTSFLYCGFETLAVVVAAIHLLGINTYGVEVGFVAIILPLNSLGVALDVVLTNMASSIISVRTKTDARIPLKDTI